MENTYLKTHFLVNYRTIREDLIVNNYINFIKQLSTNDDIDTILKAYSDFLFELRDKDLSHYITKILLKVPQNSKTQPELAIMKELTQIKYEDIKSLMLRKFPQYKEVIELMPEFENSGIDMKIEEVKKAPIIRTFIFDEYYNIKPIDMVEPFSFKDLKGYKQQKDVLYSNTRALLDGKKVNHVLLYGDAGCGKSTSVRALLNEFDNIKIIQVYKDNLVNLGKLFELLKGTSDKYIIFADDISFDEDEDLSTMKAVLEGSLVQCPSNVVIYATTNRRHMVKETFQSRIGDEIHLNDTINETTSLSERFGITLLFARPTNEEFIRIVLEIAHDYNLDIKDEEIARLAQKVALAKGTQSPRVARQLVDNLRAKVGV